MPNTTRQELRAAKANKTREWIHANYPTWGEAAVATGLNPLERINPYLDKLGDHLALDPDAPSHRSLNQHIRNVLNAISRPPQNKNTPFADASLHWKIRENSDLAAAALIDPFAAAPLLQANAHQLATNTHPHDLASGYDALLAAWETLTAILGYVQQTAGDDQAQGLELDASECFTHFLNNAHEFYNDEEE